MTSQQHFTHKNPLPTWLTKLLNFPYTIGSYNLWNYYHELTLCKPATVYALFAAMLHDSFSLCCCKQGKKSFPKGDDFISSQLGLPINTIHKWDGNLLKSIRHYSSNTVRMHIYQDYCTKAQRKSVDIGDLFHGVLPLQYCIPAVWHAQSSPFERHSP